MSNPLAIAAVTTTLRSLLIGRLGAVDVTARPLDKARNGANTNQINLFLYQTAADAALVNMPMPGRGKPGESGQAPLPLTLYYLISSYGQNDDDIQGHRLLGQAMSVLHDHPLLGSAEIRDACAADLAESDLHNQIERVRITREPMSVDEMSKLWMTFKSEYRISAAYQVSVVLIESRRATRTPLPVLTRGSEDEGARTQADLNSPFPTLAEVVFPRRQFSALLGDVLTISGLNLDGTNVRVRLSHPLLAADRVLSPQAGNTATEIHVAIPNEPANLPAGFYSLAVEVIRPGELFSRTTNKVVFALAPEISSPMPMTVARVGNDATINITCRPDVRLAQRAALLVGAREVLADPPPLPPALPPPAPPPALPPQSNTLSFKVSDAVPGEYFVRLRVDGVDSVVFDRSNEDAPPTFDQTQKVTIT
jgi:hypothetical protein